LNNVTQLALAVHSYEFHFEALPPGVTNPTGPIRNEAQGDHTSWIARILPYMEENVLFRRYDASAGAYAAKNAEVQAAQISILTCPSDPNEELRVDDGEQEVALNSYAGCHHDVEAAIDADNHGLLFLNSMIRYNEIDDGSTKTILLGEKPVDPDGLGWLSGTRATLRNTGTIEQPKSWSPAQREELAEEEKKDDMPESLFVGGFGSYHPGTVIIAFADGSTRPLSADIDRKILRLLGHRADGEIVKRFH
jgi:hypothetical protein